MKGVGLGFTIIIVAILYGVSPSNAADNRTLTGKYMSGYQDGEQAVRAVFKPTGEDTWNVDFNFRFNGQDHIYGGTAEGSLSEGALRGKVVNESRRRTFVFRGEFEAGKFTGRHAEIKRRGERQTGTITLSE